MVKFLINRPIAVFLSFIGVIFFSILAIRQLPVSLLPEIEVPSVVIKVDYPNNPARIIENSALRPIRGELNALNNLTSIESTASSESGLIKLKFDYGTRMNLAYVEINEKIDRLQETLPRDMDRPKIIRINTSDIPIIRLQIMPKPGTDFIELSELAEKVLKKRLEQLEGVSIVDLNGNRSQFISITPDREALAALGINSNQIDQVLQSANQDLGQLSIKDGQYRYFVRMANRLDDLDEIKSLPLINREGDVIPLQKVAEVGYENEKVLSYHLFNQEEGLVITVHKQSNAKMTELVPLVYEAIDIFKTDYPEVDFDMTQDQSTLLNAGINNLGTSLIYGGIFAFAVLFLFMGNVRMPIIMGITLPVSLVISFLLFYAVGLSINIISLSGLALGLGMLIDNAIIVIDNITRKRKEENLSIVDACVEGVNEVMAPLISSMLTTLAVFVPLVFLNGLSGSLFYDQAVSVSIILATSLLVAFILLPLLYRLFFQHVTRPIKEDSAFFRLILKIYKAIYSVAWRFRTLSFMLLLLLIPLTGWMVYQFEKSGLPEIEKTETLVNVVWNEPIDAEANKARVETLLEELPVTAITESDIGIKQFLLAIEEASVEKAELYFKFETPELKNNAERWMTSYLSQRHPNASFEIKDAPNAFDQIFVADGTYFTAKWKNLGSDDLLTLSAFEELKEASTALVDIAPTQGMGFVYEEALEAKIDKVKLAAYGIDEGQFKTALNNALDGYLITEIKRFGEVTPVKIKKPEKDLQEQLRNMTVRGGNNQSYQLDEFINLSFVKSEKNITSDRTGIYQSLEWEEISNERIEKLSNALPVVAANQGLTVDFGGTYFQDQENLKQLIFILIVSVTLLYFILAAQFESLVQPLIVVFTLPMGIFGAVVVLSLANVSLNVMSAIGVIVMLGIMVNDAILKIDTINRLKKKGLAENTSQSKKEVIAQAIARAGQIRLKPILMTSITTILALLPVIFSSGLGADLQRPLVFSVIGGLTLGTFTSLYFVPLAYWFSIKKK